MTKRVVYTVTRSPHPEDDPPPWSYGENAFCAWVHEVFLEGYKRDVPMPSPGDAMEILINAGYEVEIG